ncbi:CPBP family intramembrane glutamic endopeptidase [Confluentibacter sediminis]|uniref:CPBP family intramembrane glutamic endopeptidase n=1 Tax=Confluentibacter sediminis TaxID=2219045 RepID=UPI000DAB3F72|nr:type II CAAX endopeptidase family protein [Confluentibacter sediminis]
MRSISYKWIEFLILFIFIPISYTFNYHIVIKMIIGILGFVYVIYILLEIEKKAFKMSRNINWKLFLKETLLKFLIIAVLTTLFVYFNNKSLLFSVMLSKPLLWVFMLFVYSFLSVYPQELIYRTLYFQRYKSLFKCQHVFILINALVFAMAHMFFKNSLVLVITFLGGLLFAITYYKTKSTLLVSIEHAMYGCWLFTVGMGGMLGFPT